MSNILPLNRTNPNISEINEIVKLTANSDYFSIILDFFNVTHIDNINILDITNSKSKTVIEYLKSNHNGKTYNTLNKIRCAISKYFEAVELHQIENGLELIQINPANNIHVKNFVKSFAIKNQPKEYFPLDVNIIDKLINTIEEFESNPKAKERNKLMIKLLFGAGLRREGLVGLKYKDVFVENNIVFLKTTCKGNHRREVDIGKHLYFEILKYKNRWGLSDDDYLISKDNGDKINKSTINYTINKYLKYIDDKICPHDLRRLFAIVNEESGASIYDIQKLMGHSSPNTTQIYLNRGKRRKRNFVEVNNEN